MKIIKAYRIGCGGLHVDFCVDGKIFSRWSIGKCLLWWKHEGDYIPYEEIEGIFNAFVLKDKIKEQLQIEF